MGNITILGAGLMGSAVAWPLTDNGHYVRLVGTHLDADIIRSCIEHRYHPRLRRQLPDRVQPFYVEQLPDALHDADLIVSGVNSLGVHWIGRTLGPLLRPGATIVAVTKGLEANEEGNPRILPEVLRSELTNAACDGVSLAAIAGPCIAGELAGRRHSCVVFTSTEAKTLARLRSTFQTSYYHVATSTDLVGVEVCAALKNAYTVAVGMAYGMLERSGGPDEADSHMHNLAAAIFGASSREMAKIVAVMGGAPENVTWLPGVGDQYVTCVGGRTIRLGRLLGMGRTYAQAQHEMAGETLEGAFVAQQLSRTLPLWTAEGRIGPNELPLLRMLCKVITEDAPQMFPFEAICGT
jgi:glycerol-3-phosphate dehydrogenase (NAD(P)+)